MKKTDDRSRWEPAPVNDKDVVWDFVIEGLSSMTNIIENPKFCKVAAYGSDGALAIIAPIGNKILIESDTPQTGKEMAHYIADSINEEEGNNDLYAEISKPDCNSDLDMLQWKTTVDFYYTDPS